MHTFIVRIDPSISAGELLRRLGKAGFAVQDEVLELLEEHTPRSREVIDLEVVVLTVEDLGFIKLETPMDHIKAATTLEVLQAAREQGYRLATAEIAPAMMAQFPQFFRRNCCGVTMTGLLSPGSEDKYSGDPRTFTISLNQNNKPELGVSELSTGQEWTVYGTFAFVKPTARVKPVS
ncbi:hypothetical protein HON52_05035 [Candidatus Uhrbacteria bacterium]|jgi:hypothetical protein|nr:hypothetical protein [Candidatus Uhrbacteria bacterium]